MAVVMMICTTDMQRMCKAFTSYAETVHNPALFSMDLVPLTAVTEEYWETMAASKFQLQNVKDAAERIREKVKETPLEVCTTIKN